MLELEFDRIADPIVRENFSKLLEYVRTENLLLGGFKFFELTFTQAETNKKIPHGLGYRPKDIIQTSITGDGDVLWHYANFDATHIEVSTSDACVVRVFIGSYSNSGA